MVLGAVPVAPEVPRDPINDAGGGARCSDPAQSTNTAMLFTGKLQQRCYAQGIVGHQCYARDSQKSLLFSNQKLEHELAAAGSKICDEETSKLVS